MPLSVPVDVNPIVKEPPVFQDGNPTPVNNPSLLDHPTITGYDAAALAYDDINDILFVLGPNNTTIYKFSGVSTNQIGTLTSDIATAGSSLDLSAGFTEETIVFSTDGSTIAQISSSDGSIIQSGIDVSSEFSGADDIAGMAVLNGDMYLLSTTNENIYRYDGISNVLKDTLDVSPLGGVALRGIAWVNGSLCLGEEGSFQIYVLSGFSTSTIRILDVSQYNQIWSMTGANEGSDASLLVTIQRASDNDDFTSVFPVGDNGVNFKGNSGKIVESGKIYSLDIVGPNTVESPTINDDGQGEFAVVLPGGATIPIGALTGSHDFLFNGSNYILQSLTSGLAEAIYNFDPSVLNNMNATSDPTVNDDTDAGYSVRSRWFNTSTSEVFMCVDPTAGAAIWLKASLTLDELGSAATVEADQNLQTTDTVVFANIYSKSEVDAEVSTVPLQKPSTSSDPSLALDTWRTPNTNRPTFVQAELTAQTDGVSNGVLSIDVDESGGTTADYDYRVLADKENANLVSAHGLAGVIVPAGGSYQFNNQSDPNTANQVFEHREFTL